MGSFQQIVMGVGCLIAAFWFGSVLQDRPAGQNPTAELLPDGTIDPYRASASPNLVAKTKGFLNSIFESPNKEKPITVADLRQSSPTALPNLPSVPVYNGLQSPNSQNFGYAEVHPIGEPPAENIYTQAETAPAQQRFVGSFQSAEAPEMLAKVAIVPDFSSLAEEVNQGLSFNNPITDRPEILPARSETKVELIPVPRFSDVPVRTPEPVAQPNWEEVRQQVAEAERRLQEHRQQLTQPIPEIENSVSRGTRNFWDRQQAEARRRPVQPTRLTASEPVSASQQRRLKPETWTEKQKRWDVFSNNGRSQTYQGEARNQPAASPAEERDRDHFIHSHSRASMPRPDSQPRRPQPPRRTTPTIVEVDRPFVSQTTQAQRPNADTSSSARVRSLNDERFETENYYQPQRDRVAYDERQRRPAEVQNQLRPKFNPNASSKPEFVSPPDFGQFSPQANPAPSQGSGIVEAAEGTYGNFSEYETKPQDTLQSISEKFYGSADYYFDLYLANRDQLSNPATVPTGITIRVPKFDAR